MKKKQILIIEDDLSNQKIIRMSLKDFGAEIAVTDNGADGWDLVAKLQPDLVFLDIMMPKMSGFEVLKKMQSENLTSKIAVIVVSAKVNSDAHHEVLELGARDFLTKPFRVADIQQLAQKHLEPKI